MGSCESKYNCVSVSSSLAIASLKALWGGHTAALQFMLGNLCSADSCRLAREGMQFKVGDSKTRHHGNEGGKHFLQKISKKLKRRVKMSSKMHAIEHITAKEASKEGP